MKISLLLLILVISGCQSAHDSTTKDLTSAPQIVTSEDTKIDYDICGQGDFTVILIHGWCIDRTYWEAQLETLCEQYQVVTLDLPSHGTSGGDRKTWSIEQFGQDVAALIIQLNLKKIILVGHSMGGDIMLETALQHKDRIVGLVGVDNFKDAGVSPDSLAQAEIEGFMNYIRADFQGAIDVFSSQFLFSNQTDSVSKLRILNSLKTADTAMAVQVLESIFAYAPKEVPNLAELGLKLYLINSDVTPTVRKYLFEKEVPLEIIDIAGTGHYPMIEKPEEFTRLLLQTLAKIRSSQPQ